MPITAFERQLPALAEAEPSRHKQCHEAIEPVAS